MTYTESSLAEACYNQLATAANLGRVHASSTSSIDDGGLITMGRALVANA